jgi:hypothetical protein
MGNDGRSESDGGSVVVLIDNDEDSREPALRRARIIALTCLAWEHEPKRLRDAVFDRVLLKPIPPVVVRDVVLAALSAPRRRSGEWRIRSPITLAR